MTATRPPSAPAAQAAPGQPHEPAAPVEPAERSQTRPSAPPKAKSCCPQPAGSPQHLLHHPILGRRCCRLRVRRSLWQSQPRCRYASSSPNPRSRHYDGVVVAEVAEERVAATTLPDG